MALDPILTCRLDLLGDAAAEVSAVIEAMTMQRSRLEKVAECLKPGGLLNSLEDDLKTSVGDVGVRLDVLDGAVVDKLDQAQRQRLADAYDLVKKAQSALSELAVRRAEGDDLFKGIREWSVAALLEEPLRTASDHYKFALRSIRKSQQPWTEYHAAFYGPVHELFSAYIELLGGMAVRGWTAHTDGFRGIATRIRKRIDPFSNGDQTSGRSPLAPMCMSQHLPLGYESWNLWALPLMAYDASREVLDRAVLTAPVPGRLAPVCADIFSSYALGPSYPFASVLLGLDPKDAGDRLRAGLLLEYLVAATAGTDAAAWVAERAGELTDAWNSAVTAVGEIQSPPGEDDRAAIKTFVEEVEEMYPEQRFSEESLLGVDARAAYLVGERAAQRFDAENDDLLTAMWVARLEHPDQVPKIHERARELARDSATGRLDVGAPRASAGFSGSPSAGL